MSLDPAHVDELAADPRPMLDALRDTSREGHAQFCARLAEIVEGVLYRQFGPPGEGWRSASRAEVAEEVALDLGCVLSTLMEEEQERNFLLALADVKADYDRRRKEQGHA